MKRRNRSKLIMGIFVVALILVGVIVARRRSELVLVTAYCNCEKCCSWERLEPNGEAVYSTGRLKGQRKVVGITASGTRAKHGTVAADPKVFPFGTRLRIPGYGIGTVEDIGGAIKNRHIDIWFPTHAEATAWGSRRLEVEVIR